MKVAKILSWHIILISILSIGAFELLDDKFNLYASNLFYVFAVLAGLRIIMYIFAILETATDVMQEIASERNELHPVMSHLISIADMLVIAITYMVGWHWLGSIFLIRFLLLRSILANNKETIFNILKRKST